MGKAVELREVEIAALKPYERNAKKHSKEQVGKIGDSIRRLGFLSPCLIDKDMNVIAGHGRIMAAKLIGWETVPCVFIEGLTAEERKAYIIADNRLTELGEWNMDMLQQELEELADADFDISLTGFDPDLRFDNSMAEITEDGWGEEQEEQAEEPRSRIGDIYRLGNHRLMCGDSTDADMVETLMDGEKAELLLTDPPYGIDVVCHSTRKIGGDKPITVGKVHGNAKNAIIQQCKEYAPIIGDDTTDTAKSNYEIAKQHSENQVIFGGNYFTDFLTPSRCWVVWDKQNSGTFADAELAWTSFDKVVKLYHFMWNGLCREGSRTVEGKTRVHPTQKPVGLMANILADFCSDKGTVLDCFGGSGSTLIACEQTGRKCYMMELDPHYVDVIISRWEKLTGRQAVLVGNFTGGGHYKAA